MNSPRAAGGKALPARLALAAAASTVAGQAQAAALAAVPGAGWFFAAVALVVVAWLAYRLGAARERTATERREREQRRRDAAIAASGIGTLWRCDAKYALVELDADAPADRPWRGTPVWEFFGGDDAAALRMAIEAHGLLAPRRARMGEGADAAAVEIGAAPLADDDGRYAGHIGWMRPAAAMAPAQQHEPGAAEDAAALSFAVSHDLRAPVRVVEGFARILKEDYGDRLDRVGNDHLERVLSAAARMNQMIDALLFIAKLATQPLVRQPVNLSQLAQYVVDELRRSTPEREARVEIEPGLQASGDPTMLRVALENLLGNAWKYTQRNRDALVSLRGERQGDKRVFVVQDNGTGFDMRSSDRLFGLFQRLHSASEFPGTGVGLASVRRIVRRHGGEIWAESEPGRGATFRFTLGE